MFSKISKIGLPNKEDRIEKLNNQLNYSLFKLEEQLPIEFQKDIKADREHIITMEKETKDKRDKAFKGQSKSKRRKTSICNLLPTNFNVRSSINNMNNNDLIKYRSKRSSLNLDTENSSVKPMKSVKTSNKKSKLDFKEIVVSNKDTNKKSIEFDFYPEYHLEAHKKESFLHFNDDYVMNTNKNVHSNKLSTAFNSIDVKSINHISNKSKDNCKTENYLYDKKLNIKDSILKSNAKHCNQISTSKKLNLGTLHQLSEMKNCITESIVNQIHKASNNTEEERENDSITSKIIIKDELDLKDIDYLETIDYNKRKNFDEKIKNNHNTIETGLSSSLAIKNKNKAKINNKVLSSHDIISNKLSNSKKNDVSNLNLNSTKKKATLSFKFNNFDFNNDNDKIENLPQIQINKVKGK